MKSPKILIVEDERHITKFLEFILNKEGCRTQIATSGREALEALETFYPDGILLDLGLPDMNGLDLLRQMREDGRIGRTKVIILSATLFEGMSEQLDAAGADARCSKPVAPSTIVRLLQNLDVLPVAA